MLDFGFSEIVLTSAIALIVLGPEKLPKVARQVGNWMGRARAMARQLTEQLEREVNAEDLLKQTARSAKTSANPISSEPAAFDTSHAPPAAYMLPAAHAPPAAPPQAAAAAPSYTADPALSPHGADWHTAANGNKPPNE